MLTVLGLLVGMVMLVAPGAARVTSPAGTPDVGAKNQLLRGLTAAVVDPNNVTQTVTGCRNDGTITLPNGSGKFICPDAAYTGGNLGKGWNELDLVPFRLTTHAGNSAPATQTYDTGVAFDAFNAGHPGYDVIGPLVLNTAESDASCVLNSQSAQTTITPGFGGIDQSIGRTVNITQAKGSTCVFDYYGRLALGSHLFPGASLHGNLSDGTLSGSNQDVPIPVKEITPQQLSKDMTASEGSDHVWDISKSPTPASVNFQNTCDTTNPANSSQGVQIKVTWTKEPAVANGPITVITHIYATNPASRVVTLSLTDQILSGTTLLDTASAGPTDLAANTTMLVLTHTFQVPQGTTNLNDIATGSYTDKVTGIPIPGTTQATASAPVQFTGPETNASAVIADSESISGTGFQFSADSTSGATGSFDSGYTAGTKTVGPVGWTSATQSDSGSVTFNKTIYAASGSSANGELDDTATLTGSDGFTTHASASVAVSADKTASLEIDKSIPNVLQAGDPDQTFTFNVYDSSSNLVATKTLTFKAGGPISQSVTLSGLVPDTYTVKEAQLSGWSPQPDQSVNLTSACSGSATFANKPAPAFASAVKITDPIGHEAGWTMILNGPGTPSGGEQVATDSNGNAAFTTTLQEGSYTITEQSQAGWDQTNATGDCSFTVNYPADGGKTFTCTITNTERGHIIVQKVTVPSGSSQLFTFNPSWGSSFQLKDGGSNDSGALVPGAGYSVSETVPDGWDQTGATCDNNDDPSSITLNPGQTVTCTFTNTERGHIVVKKVTDPSGSTQSFTFNPSWGSSFPLSDGGSQDSGALVPGSYSVGEATTAGWDLTSATCDNNDDPSAITLAAGQTVTCTFKNTQRAHLIIQKVTHPSGSTQSFNFSSSGPNGYSNTFALKDGGSNDSGAVKPGSGYSASETVPAGWDQTGATCDNGNDPSSITLNPGQTVTCTFTNTQEATITVKKVTNPTTATDKFTFTGDLAGSIGNGQSITATVKPGDYTTAETVPAGWDLTQVSCQTSGTGGTFDLPAAGSTQTTYHVPAGGGLTCTYTNTERGTLIVKKVTDPSPDPSTSSFSFTDGGGLSPTSFSLKNGGQQEFDNVVAQGGYSVAEGSLTGTGWTLKSSSCNGTGNTPASITINPGQTVTCTFTNISRGTVRVIKAINNSPITGAQDFQFELRLGSQKLASTPALQTLHANVGNGGQIDFTNPPTGLVPGQTYAICELLQPGYNPTISGYGPYNPADNTNYWCWDFSITVAQAASTPSLTFNVENDHPSSKGLTIGYWKNHASCKKSNGGQSDTLGQFLAGIMLGNKVTFNQPGPPWECEAVQTLSKNTWTGTNKSSDPLFNMAAQLLAAKLNINAKDGVCSSLVTAMNGADGLLSKYSWNGNSYTGKLSSTDAALANQYATALDKYNNNQLC